MRRAGGEGIAGRVEEHIEVLSGTERPRDYFRRFEDLEVWALSEDAGFRDVLLASVGAEKGPGERLYDLLFDPDEAHDLAAGTPGHAGPLEGTRGRLEKGMYDDAIDGPVPALEEAGSNARDQLSANDTTTTAA